MPLLLIADSQGSRDILHPEHDMTVMFKSGATARQLLEITQQVHYRSIDISTFQDIAIWVGGNDAIPRSGGEFSPANFAGSYTSFIGYLRSLSPQANIYVLAATPRTRPAKITPAITKVNKTLSAVANTTGARFVNSYRSMERCKTITTKLVDGIHLSKAMKRVIVTALYENVIQASFAKKTPPPPSANNGPIRVQGEKAILSMFFPTPLMFGGYEHYTPEHAYQYQKCVLLGRQDVADDIKKVTSPRAAKKLGGGVNGNITNRQKSFILQMVL